MPVDQDGNITTTPSVDVKTWHDVIREDKKDGIALMVGGMARTAQDTGGGIELGSGAAYVLPAATTAAIGGVKKAASVSALAAGADAAAIVTGFNDLLAKLKAAGIVT